MMLRNGRKFNRFVNLITVTTPPWQNTDLGQFSNRQGMTMSLLTRGRLQFFGTCFSFCRAQNMKS